MKSHDVTPAEKDDSNPIPSTIQPKTGSLFKKTRPGNITFLDLTTESCEDCQIPFDRFPECAPELVRRPVNDAPYSASMRIQKTVPNTIVCSTSTNGNGLSTAITSTQTANTECQLQDTRHITVLDTQDSDESYDSEFWEGHKSSKTTRLSKPLPNLSEPSASINCCASSTAFTSTPNANPESMMEHTCNASVPNTNLERSHDRFEKIIIDGKPYDKEVIDALDDNVSVVYMSKDDNEIPAPRLGETLHEIRVRRLNNDLADRIIEFINEIRQWEHQLIMEFKNFVYSDKEWAYCTLPTVASDIRSQKILVASLNMDCLMQNISGVETKRTAHWLMKFSNHKGEKFQMEPKGNLCTREYKFYSEFCLDQSVE